VTFAKNTRRPFDPKRSRFVLPRYPPAMVVRIVLLAALGVFAAAWALASHYGARLPPMLRPLQAPPPSAMPTYDPEAGEIPVPDLDLEDGG
jgi:hypothetical protein